MCIEMLEPSFQNQTKARRKYNRLKDELEDLPRILSKYFGRDVLALTPHSIISLIWGIEKEIESLLRNQQEDSPGQGMMTEKGAAGILKRYCRVLTLFGRIALNESTELWRLSSEQEVETLLSRLPYSPAAQYRGTESYGLCRNGCTPNTRMDVLKQLQYWADYNSHEKIYWLSGTASTGKTTIAYTLCGYLQNTGKPAASFFCSRQLPMCRDLPRPFRWAISYILERNPEVQNQSLPEQFKRMVVMPLQKVGHTFLDDVIVVVDAVDECEDNDGLGWILSALFKLASDMPIKLFLTGPDDSNVLSRLWSRQDERFRSKLCLDELEQSIVQQDINTYLMSNLCNIDLSAADPARLTKLSGGLFIHAAVATRYIVGDSVSGSAERVKQVLDTAVSSSNDNKQRNLDALYAAVLHEALDCGTFESSEKYKMNLVLHTLACAREPLTVNTFSSLLWLDNADIVGTTSQPLFPVVRVSEASGVVAILHQSFRDFMVDRNRSCGFHCDAAQHNARLAQRCSDPIKVPNPPFNICNLESSYSFDSQVPGLNNRVNRAISPELLYACLYWSEHLERTKNANKLVGELDDFLSTRLLLWMEVLNLKRHMYDGAKALCRIRTWLQTVKSVNVPQQLMEDACRFAISYVLSPASNSTPHIYVSPLTFWPEQSPIAERYIHYPAKLPQAIANATGSREGTLPSVPTPNNMMTLADRNSADDTRILSGSSSRAVRMLNAHSSRLSGSSPLDYLDWIMFVAYSPDGAYIASGFDDHTIRIWDVNTGWQGGKPLRGHSNSIKSVAYSPNGAYIVSGSYDYTIRIWSAHTSRLAGQPLKGHKGSVNSVGWAPDGACIIWDIHTSQSIGTLKGHTSFVNSVAYSPDGAYIVSGSYDRTVRIWDAQIHKPVGQPLCGHTQSVSSVAWSPNGARIVSGAWDDIIRIWDAHTSQLIGQPLKGHVSWVRSVAYSPDSAYIVSGASDYTVRIWGAHTGQVVEVQPLDQGRDIGRVDSVAYSPMADTSSLVATTAVSECFNQGRVR